MKIRKSAFAGSWYPSDKKELYEQLKDFFDNVEYVNKNVRAIIVPHAGYIFSGQTAASAYKQIKSDINEVYILGTAHRFPLKGVNIVDYDYYESPLGKVRLSEKCKALLKEKNFYNIPQADENEHSIELQIPFLQYILKDFKIIPMLVGRITYQDFNHALKKYLTDNSLIVVSVDLSHFHNYQKANELDKYSIESILELNAENIVNAEIDSPNAVISIIHLSIEKKWKVKLMDYKNSGDIIKNKSSVVGYSSIIFYEE